MSTTEINQDSDLDYRKYNLTKVLTNTDFKDMILDNMFKLTINQIQLINNKLYINIQNRYILSYDIGNGEIKKINTPNTKDKVEVFYIYKNYLFYPDAGNVYIINIYSNTIIGSLLVGPYKNWLINAIYIRDDKYMIFVSHEYDTYSMIDLSELPDISKINIRIINNNYHSDQWANFANLDWDNYILGARPINVCNLYGIEMNEIEPEGNLKIGTFKIVDNKIFGIRATNTDSFCGSLKNTEIAIFNKLDSKLIERIQINTSSVIRLEYNNGYLYCGQEDGCVKVWDIGRKQCVDSLQAQNKLIDIQINDNYFVIAGEAWIYIYQFQESYKEKDNDINKSIEAIDQIEAIRENAVINNNLSGSSGAGIVYGNISNASTTYGMDKFNTPRGHGFAAERANHIYDKLAGKDAMIVGDDNAKFGADRIVDGINIQSKYCNSGSKCIQECFKDGKLVYLNPDGTPMKIEVPSDKYDAAVQSMKNRIKNGEVPGITDPNEAENIVRKGHFTYEQARNIAKAGRIESITFDAVNGAIIASTAFGLSTALTFATSIWNGNDFNVALKTSVYSGLKIGGVTFVTAVLASQISKAGLNSLLVGSSEAIVSIMGPKASAMLINAFRSGTNIYGAAAMKSAAKLLRGNAITGAVSVAVLSSVDVVNIFRGRISGAQLFKNVANTASTVAGGTAGWVGGATAGAAVGSFIPVLGTAIGGVLGGIIGSVTAGSVAGKVSNAVLSEFIEDDADEMVSIIEKVFTQMAEDYLLNQKEAENIIDSLKDDLTSSTLKDMFASSDRKEFARKLLMNHVESEVRKRKKIGLPSHEEMQKGLRIVLEEISDSMSMA